MDQIYRQYTQGMNMTANIAALMPDTPVAGVSSAETSHVALSAESLLYYCSSRLDSVDQQIDRYFKDQQAKNRASKELSDVQGVLGQATWQKAGTDPTFSDADADYHVGAANQLLTIYRNAQSPEGKQAAAEAFALRTGQDINAFTARDVQRKDIMAGKGKIVAQDAAQWTQRIDNIKSKSSEVSKSAELNMIQLQSLVSQRQLAVQLTTQLMQAVHESMKGIAANCRA